MALYFRSILALAISLYTYRIILDALGASDYGLYAVIGSAMALIAVLSTAMASSTQRFLNFGRGKGDADRLRRVFGTSLFIHLLLAGVVVLLAQTVGLWLVNSVLNIPPGRLEAANWVFQCVVASAAISIVSTPFVAAIVANERMTAFAYVSLLDATTKLLIAYVLEGADGDRLKLYAVLMLAASAISVGIYVIYARRQFPECAAAPRRDRQLFSQMLSFSGWNLTSNISVVLRMQGNNVLLNLFFGTFVNAAMGIATQVNTNIRVFATNFTQALNPQIVQTYASGEMIRMTNIIFTGSRLTFFLMLMISLPVIVNADFVIGLWLIEIPEYTIVFVQLFLIQTQIEAFAPITGTAQAATGRVKTYHLVLSAIGLLNLPVSYVLLSNGMPPTATLVVAIIFSSLIALLRLVFLRRSISLSIRQFARQVLLPCLLVVLVAGSFSLLLSQYLPAVPLRSVLVLMGSFVSVVLAVGLIGLNKEDRMRILGMVGGRFWTLRSRRGA